MKKLLTVLCAAITLNAAAKTNVSIFKNMTGFVQNRPISQIAITHRTPTQVTKVIKDLLTNTFTVVKANPQEFLRLRGDILIWGGDKLEANTTDIFLKPLIDLANAYHRAYAKELKPKYFQASFEDNPLTRAKLRAKLRSPEGTGEEEERKQDISGIQKKLKPKKSKK